MIASTETKSIGDYDYEVSKMLARDGLRLGLRVGQLIAPFVGAISNPSEASLAQAVADCFARPELANEIEGIAVTLGKVTQVKWLDERGQPKSQTLTAALIDTHFQDRYDAFLEWLVFAATANLRSFFAGASQLGAKLKAQAKPEAKTPSASASPSPSPVERTG